MALVEDNRIRVEMVREPRVVLLARGVANEVEWPSEELLSEQVG